MAQNRLGGYFEKFLKKEPLFVNRKVLQDVYKPEEIIHREDQIDKMAGILAPCLRSEKPSNLFIYGKTGTGKTLSVKHTADELTRVAASRGIPLKFFYLNCKLKRVADTEYRLIAQLAREYGKAIPPTGLPTDEVYRIFFEAIDEKEQVLVLVLDEIDQLVKKTGDEILYNLTRINNELKRAQISIVGVSNDLMFVDVLDPRVRSSLSEEEVVFPPYNALQIQDILKHRSRMAFKPDCLAPGVVEKCAAYAAREHGDARRALELLRVAGELAERENNQRIQIKHIDLAEEKIERDRVLDIVETQPKQFQAVLYVILSLCSNNQELIFTGEVYDLYKEVCSRTGLRPLTQRRVSDVIGELDLLGIINAKVISKGRYGRTREISLSVPPSTNTRIRKILHEELNLG